ncbi:IclR family transcriptional regulator [Achromobacter aloeverae]|uniref:IclR family transcriptional regulator n=1 Tax=Achromobacter aloeverae TaxID=1750518 RepID=UPI0018644E82|nr:IclR family transcriptional regulator [Achromobacter aloeverae]
MNNLASDSASIDPADLAAAGATRSPVRTVQLLHTLASTASGATLAALAADLRLPKTSVFRLLRSLELCGYVEVVKGAYQLGPAARELGKAIMLNYDFGGRAHQTLQWLASKCGQTVILGTLAPNGADVIYSSVIEGVNPLRFTINAGAAKPLQCSASGQVLLAFMQAKALEKFYAEVVYTRHATGTIMTREHLDKALRKIRKTGIAVSVNGMDQGVYSVAAPVVDASATVCAGISVSAPEAHAADHAEEYESLVRQAGGELSRLLGYAGDYPPAA